MRCPRRRSIPASVGLASRQRRSPPRARRARAGAVPHPGRPCTPRKRKPRRADRWRCASASAGAPGSTPQRPAPTSTSTYMSITAPAFAAACRQRGHGRKRIDQHADRRPGCKVREPRDFRRRDDFVGDEHVAYAGIDERDRLVGLLAADADRAPLDLRARDRRALVRLRVRAQARCPFVASAIRASCARTASRSTTSAGVSIAVSRSPARAGIRCMVRRRSASSTGAGAPNAEVPSRRISSTRALRSART